jgi:uncharacterized membrane protein
VRSRPDPLARLERTLGRILVTGVVVSALLLAGGLALWLAHPSAAGLRLLNAGLIVLMATPILRVLVSFAEYVRIRDWIFAGATVIVLIELGLAAGLAIARNR